MSLYMKKELGESDLGRALTVCKTDINITLPGITYESKRGYQAYRGNKRAGFLGPSMALEILESFCMFLNFCNPLLKLPGQLYIK